MFGPFYGSPQRIAANTAHFLDMNNIILPTFSQADCYRFSKTIARNSKVRNDGMFVAGPSLSSQKCVRSSGRTGWCIGYALFRHFVLVCCSLFELTVLYVGSLSMWISSCIMIADSMHGLTITVNIARSNELRGTDFGFPKDLGGQGYMNMKFVKGRC